MQLPRHAAVPFRLAAVVNGEASSSVDGGFPALRLRKSLDTARAPVGHAWVARHGLAKRTGGKPAKPVERGIPEGIGALNGALQCFDQNKEYPGKKSNESTGTGH